MKKIIYIAGQMTGLPDKGRGLFRAAADCLREMGAIALDPSVLPDNLSFDAYMPICLAMLEQADAVLLLPSWECSRGAALEKAYAEYQRKEIIYLDKGNVFVKKGE